MMALVILFLDVEKIAKLASAFKVSMFILVNICVIVLRETAVQWYAPKYKSPLYPYVQLFGVLSGFILLFYLGMMPLIAILFISIIGCIIYFTYGIKASRTGVLKRYGHMPASYLLFGKKRNYTHLKELEDKEREELVHINIDKEAGVIIPLLGNEVSPETLIELGASLNNKEKIQTLNITEVPDQTSLNAFREKRPKTKSLERMVKTLSNRMNLKINFESIATHKLSETMQALSEITNIDWLVLGWNGRAYNGIFFNNPIGWIVSNINSNFALFKCNGVMRFNNVLLAIRPNSRDSVKLIETTNKLCNYYNAEFTLLHVVPTNMTSDEVNYIKQKANDLLKGNELLIALYEKSEEIKEIIIRSSKLIGVLEVDVKLVPKDKFTRIKINGIRQTYEIARPRAGDFASPIAALFQPVDFLYKLFGKKPKQLKKLQKIKKEDNLRKIMAGKFDREVMMEYLEMDRNDLMKLISDCNYSDYFVKNASDLQMIEAVLDCYETYKALKLGKIERSRLPTKKRN